MRYSAALATLAAAAGLAASTTAGVGAAVGAAPTDVCVIEDSRATELSGLVALETGYVVVNDSQDDAGAIRVIYLDAGCAVTRTVRYPSTARDPEDLAVAPDGALWVADIGDNVTSQERRRTIALWRVPADGGSPLVHRLSYPDGPHDAEALLFSGDGTPVVITKDASGKSGLYVPSGPIEPNSTAGVPLQRVGEFTPLSTGENNFLGTTGELLVTGAATAPDRSRVVLRTYTAAYEWDVPDGDVVKAITTGTPRLTALPDEPQGEAIAYTVDGTRFVTLSDQEQSPTTLRQHVRATEPLVATPAPASPAPPADPPSTGLAAIPVWYSAAAAFGGLVLVVVGFVGLRRSRRDRSTTTTTTEPVESTG